MYIVSSNPEFVNTIESNEMALSKGLVGREAFNAYLSTLSAKNGSTEIWFKAGHDRMFVGNWNETGVFALYSTKLPYTNAPASTRVRTRKVSDDAFAYLRNFSDTQKGGVFTIPTQPQGFPGKDAIDSTDDIGCEFDNSSLVEQWAFWSEFQEVTGLTASSLLTSGSKSIHAHFKLTEHFPIAEASYVRRLMTIGTMSDSSAQNPHQPMRIPGFFRKEKGNEQELISFSQERYTIEQTTTGLKKWFDHKGLAFPVRITDEWWTVLKRHVKTAEKGDHKIPGSVPDPRPLIDALLYGIDAWEADEAAKKAAQIIRKEYHAKAAALNGGSNSLFDQVRELCEELGTDAFELREHEWEGDETHKRGFCTFHKGQTKSAYVLRNKEDAATFRCPVCTSNKPLDAFGYWLSVQEGSVITEHPTGAEWAEKAKKFLLDYGVNPNALPVSDDWLENKQQTEYQFYCVTSDCKPLSFEDWKVQQRNEWIEKQKLTNWKPQNYLKKDLTRKPDFLLNERHISESDFSIGDHDALILSPKDTGKTTWLSSIVAKKIEVTEARREQAKILSITHRKTLGSHLSGRLGLNWRNDNPNGLLMGSCIEGLAPLDINAFNGCVLVIDEIDQVLRHLLTSDTIKGNRPFYISAVKTLIKNASQIIGCSADTDDEIIKFIEKIRGKKLLLVKNEYVSKGYKAFFSASKSYGALYSRLKTRIENRTDKKVIYVASDSKNLVAKMEYDLTHKFPELRILTVTSKNSENKAQEEFMRFPNTVMASGLYDVILASPSLGTGVSFDNEDFDSVWGFFTGKSINAGDMAQSLFRVRLLCDRFIWCAEKGGFWKFGKTASTKRVRQILADRSNTNIDKAKEAVANGLKEEDFVEAEYLWKDSPFVDLYAHFIATNNRSSHNLRDELMARLSAEGHQLAVLDDSEIENATDSKSDLTTCGQQLRDVKKYALEGSKDITYEELQELQKKKEGKTEDDELAIEKYYLKEFYATDTVDTTLVEFDNEERTRIVIKELENLLNVEVAEKKGVKSLIAATQWQHPLFPGYTLKADDHALWDADSTIARRDIRIALGLMDFFNPENRTKVYTKDDYAPYAAKAREMKEEIKKFLGRDVSDKMTDVQIVNGLLSQVGLKMKRKQIRNEGGVESTYSIEPDAFRNLEKILERRAKKYEAV